MYSHIFVAGTFDGLHKGHQFLLSEAFRQGVQVMIGLTTDKFVRNVKSQKSKVKSQTYEKRKKDIEHWLDIQKKQAAIVPIDDPYEPLASMAEIEALIVTKDNRTRGEEINIIRKSRGLKVLALIEVPMVAAGDGAPISSTRVREGEIDTDGRLIMPELLRAVLGKPMGRLISATEIYGHIQTQKGRMMVTVGDMTTKTFLDAGVTPQVMIIDRLVGRNPYHEAVQVLAGFEVTSVSLKSGPGYIAKEAMRTIERMFTGNVVSTPRVILVDGEEDLLVLPAIIHAPVGWCIYYGQPKEGIVEVEVTNEKKEESKKLLGQFV